MPKNLIVAQSGGPSPVINSSLRGIIETCRMFPDKFGKVYGGWHGIEGVLKEELEFLFGRYDNLKYYDADYQKYGLGATEVYIYLSS